MANDNPQHTPIVSETVSRQVPIARKDPDTGEWSTWSCNLLWQAGTWPEVHVAVKLLDGATHRATAPFGWGALLRLRGELEPEGWYILTKGARKDVGAPEQLPEDKQLTHAYRIVHGQALTELVDIYEEEHDPQAIGIILDQMEHIQKYRAGTLNIPA